MESPKLSTAWHPPFVSAIRAVLPPDCFEILVELQLNHQPQRIDVVVRKRLPAALPEIAALRPLIRHLGPISLIEFKGPSVTLRGEDLLVLLGYAYQYRVLHGAPREQVHLIVVADRLSGPFRKALEQEGGTLAQEAPGICLVSGLAHPLCVLETAVCDDHVLRLFSRHMTTRPRDLFALLNEEERTIFRAVYQEVKRFRADPALAMRYADAQEMTMSLKELMDEMLDDVPKEDLLKRLSPEERMRGLAPEEVLRGLSPEERLRGLGAEERLRGLGAEERLRGLSPEEREHLRKLLS